MNENNNKMNLKTKKVSIKTRKNKGSKCAFVKQSVF
jgi:hypothetical protein